METRTPGSASGLGKRTGSNRRHRAPGRLNQLDQAPPTSSFPSGHTGAAVALYGCLAVIMLRNIPRRWVAVGLALVGFAIPILVAASRVYRGMHFLTDVVTGAIAGGIWLTVVLMMLLRTRTPVDSVSPDPTTTTIAAARSIPHGRRRLTILMIQVGAGPRHHRGIKSLGPRHDVPVLRRSATCRCALKGHRLDGRNQRSHCRGQPSPGTDRTR